jgi:integrase
VDLKHGRIHVRQRADWHNKIGAANVQMAIRSVPVIPLVINALKECEPSSPTLSVTSRACRISSRTAWCLPGLLPGVIDRSTGKAKCTGMHSLRHFYASWLINRPADGGFGLTMKEVQARLGHSTIQMTADTYGHLFPRGDDSAELGRTRHKINARAAISGPARGRPQATDRLAATQVC